jgi:hypothetical protein
MILVLAYNVSVKIYCGIIWNNAAISRYLRYLNVFEYLRLSLFIVQPGLISGSFRPPDSSGECNSIAEGLQSIIR